MKTIKNFLTQSLLFAMIMTWTMALSPKVLVQAQTQTPNFSQIMELLQPLVKEFPHDVIFYRWSEKSKIDQLIKERTLTPERFKELFHFRPEQETQELSSRAVAGWGIYMGENPASSSLYGSKRFVDEGALVEIKVSKGQKYLDLTHPNTKEVLEKNRISLNEIHRLHLPYIIKYDYPKGWWVIKNVTGVEFREFRGEQYSSDELSKWEEQIEYEDTSRIYRKALKQAHHLQANESVVESIERNNWDHCKRNYIVPHLPHIIEGFVDFIGRSKNYKSLEDKGNGALVIHEPYYNWRLHDRYISIESDPSGVCRHFGLGPSVHMEKMELSFWNDKNTILIDDKGIPVKEYHYDHVIKSLECLKGADQKPATAL